LQDELFREFGINPFALAWLNLVGCRPCDYAVWADNRAPNRVEMLACSERTWMLMSAIRPRVVVCLGKEATAMFWDKPPDVWTWHRLVPPDAPDDWIMVGHARHPAYLARVIGMPSNYKEYASARTFYGALREQLDGMSKTSAWRFGLRYLNGLSEPEVGR
jgi:uracil-DNA glycosylase family 4